MTAPLRPRAKEHPCKPANLTSSLTKLPKCRPAGRPAGGVGGGLGRVQRSRTRRRHGPGTAGSRRRIPRPLWPRRARRAGNPLGTGAWRAGHSSRGAPGTASATSGPAPGSTLSRAASCQRPNTRHKMSRLGRRQDGPTRKRVGSIQSMSTRAPRPAPPGRVPPSHRLRALAACAAHGQHTYVSDSEFF